MEPNIPLEAVAEALGSKHPAGGYIRDNSPPDARYTDVTIDGHFNLAAAVSVAVAEAYRDAAIIIRSSVVTGASGRDVPATPAEIARHLEAIAATLDAR